MKTTSDRVHKWVMSLKKANANNKYGKEENDKYTWQDEASLPFYVKREIDYISDYSVLQLRLLLKQKNKLIQIAFYHKQADTTALNKQNPQNIPQ